MKKAFTLIELLIVIAIIGILATIVITYALPAIGKSRDAKALALMNDAQKTAASCIIDGGTVSLTNATVPAVGANICSLSTVAGVWPDLTKNAGNGSNGKPWRLIATGVKTSGNTFTFVANASSSPTGTFPTVTCKETGCIRTN